MDQKLVDSTVEDLQDAVQNFKANPNAETLDDVYRATTAIESTCRKQLEASN